MPPGLTVTSAAATVVEALKFRLSAICTVPAAVLRTGGMLLMEKTNGCVGAPSGEVTACWASASGPGSPPWKIQRLSTGVFLKDSAGTPKFAERTSGGVCAIQSVTRSVLNSDALPLSKASRNSPPSGPRPCSECGSPGGKYQRAPVLTSATGGLPL